MALTDIICRSTKLGPKLKKLSDGGGLQLWLLPRGSKLWRLAYRYQGRQKLVSFGAYPEVTLAEARDRRDVARRQLRDGIDPSLAKKVTVMAPASTAYKGTCLVMNGSSSSNHDVVGSGDSTFEFEGSLISCNAQNSSETGSLAMYIVKEDGTPVGTSETSQPYGVVSVAGR